MTATLIFPALGQAARDYHAAAETRGERVVAAASIRDSNMEALFGAMHLLPYVHEDAFAEQFLTLVSQEGISRVVSPVASVHAFLEQFIRTHQLAATLVGDSPIQAQVKLYRDLMARAQATLPFIHTLQGSTAQALSLMEVAAVMRHYGLIYGESSDDKLAAIMAIFASAPKGDVVEIGSLMGRSLSVLLLMAQRFKTGAVLSVDPLASGHGQHNDPQAVLMSAMDRYWDYGVLREALAINMMPVAHGDFNYLRMPSEQGFEHYARSSLVASEEFGEVRYSGQIAVLHIDGNHDFAHASKDVELWLPRLARGGWLVLDDYLWAHGDGPMRVGNRLLITEAQRVECAFVCGKALFVQMG